MAKIKKDDSEAEQAAKHARNPRLFDAPRSDADEQPKIQRLSVLERQARMRAKLRDSNYHNVPPAVAPAPTKEDKS